MQRTHPLTLTLGAIVIALAGCGESSHSSSHSSSRTAAVAMPTATSSQPHPSSQPVSTGSTGQQTRAQLIARAGMICTRVNAQREKLSFKTGLQFELVLPRLTADERNLYAELSMLTPPALLRSDWAQLVAAARKLATTTSTLNNDAHSAIGQSNDKRLGDALLAEIAHARQALDTAARLIGISSCSTY